MEVKVVLICNRRAHRSQSTGNDRLRKLQIYLGILALSLIYLQPSLGNLSNLLDEGVLLSTADRITQHQSLYRDAFIHVPPLTPWLYSFFFRILGTSIAAGHFTLWLTRATSMAGLYLLSGEFLNEKYAFIPSMLFLATVVAEDGHHTYHWAATSVGIHALWMLFRALKMPEPDWRMTTAGLGIGLCLLTLHSLGGLLGVYVFFAILLNYRTRRAQAVSALLRLIVGFAIGVIPVMGILAYQGILGDFFYAIISYNAHRSVIEYRSISGVLWQFLLSVWQNGSRLANLLLALGLVTWLLEPILNRKLLRSSDLSLWLGTLLTLAAASYHLDASHMLQYSFLLWVQLVVSATRSAKARKVVPLLLVFFGVGAGYQQFIEVIAYRFEVTFPRGVVRVTSEGEAKDLQKLVNFANQRNRKNSSVYFMPSVATFSFLMGFANPSRYPTMTPLFYTRAEETEFLKSVTDIPVWYFPVFDSDEFFRAWFPRLDIRLYHAEHLWLHRQLGANHKYIDCGAVKLYEPFEPMRTGSSDKRPLR
jgi:uncharacterized membrane protein (UPF0136 family)